MFSVCSQNIKTNTEHKMCVFMLFNNMMNFSINNDQSGLVCKHSLQMEVK